MWRSVLPRRPLAGILALSLAVVLALSTVLAASATTLIQINADPFTNPTSQHKTQVEPDTFAWGSTVVVAVQSGRFFDGGASDIAWSTSTDSGVTWVNGTLPAITVYVGGPYDRVSDPSVAYDAKHNVWIISSLAIRDDPTLGPVGAAVLASRSTDGGLSWGAPVPIYLSTPRDFVDKNWTACDNTSTSPFYGNCYTEFDNFFQNDRIKMSTSTDGGLNWGAPVEPAGHPCGIGGQPLVQPNGTVIVPIDNCFETGLLAFRSTDGGLSWSAPVHVTFIAHHTEQGLRSGALISAEMDASGKVYVVWSDCRFRPTSAGGCFSNDLVMTTSMDGINWTKVTRIPLSGVNSKNDFFIPGLGVDRTTSGSSAHLSLTFYFYPVAGCGFSTCRLSVGNVQSLDGGMTWGARQQFGTSMQLGWIANTTQGRMVGDYISTSFVSNGMSVPAFELAGPTTSGNPCDVGSMDCNEATFSVVGGVSAQGPFTRVADEPVYNTQGDHPATTPINLVR